MMYQGNLKIKADRAERSDDCPFSIQSVTGQNLNICETVGALGVWIRGRGVQTGSEPEFRMTKYLTPPRCIPNLITRLWAEKVRNGVMSYAEERPNLYATMR